MRIVDDNIFTKREKEIVELLLTGANKAQIAKRLMISISTVKTYVENLYRKFYVHNRIEFLIYVIKHKIVSLDDINET